uniref:SFRICE_025182 n=1 Tax=Spodoptera frugiperda TaxID=7108 RepID=A0A2H1VS56_SPOFR
MWLIKRSDEPSTTSTHCYWSKPKLAGAISHQNFILANNIGKKKRTSANVDMTVSIGMFSEECKKRKVPQLNDCSVFNLVLQFIHQVDDHCYNNFKSFSVSKLTVDVLESIAEATKSQADSKLWHSMRQGRVTGSKIYEAIHCKTENGALVQSILGGYKVPETKAIKRGKMLEKEVVKELEKEIRAIQHTGLIFISPIIGVSPDGICSDFVIEVKCPISENTIKKYVRDGVLCEKYKAQIMVQMHAAKK